MKPFPKFAGAILFILGLSLPVAANPDQDSLYNVKIDQILILTHAQSNSEKVFDEAKAQIKEKMAELTSLPEFQERLKQEKYRKIVKNFQKDLTKILNSYFNYEHILPITRECYKKHFSLDELDQLIAMYQSPVGKLVVDKLPEIVQDISQTTATNFQGLLPQIQALREKFEKDMGNNPEN